MIDPKHAAEVRRCLLELDVVGMRRLHAHVWPHTPQPKTNEEALTAMHSARLQMKSIPPRLKEYSRRWLAERQKVQPTVGVAVGARSLRGRERAFNIKEAMLDSVSGSIKAGIDIDLEAAEVRRRMFIARDKA